MNKLPESLIIEFDKEITAFTSIVCEIDLPTIDYDATLSQLFHVLTDLETAYRGAIAFSHEAVNAEALFENHEMLDDSKLRIQCAVEKLGLDIITKLRTYGAYTPEGKLFYEFKRRINPNTILLVYNGPTVAHPQQTSHHTGPRPPYTRYSRSR